MSKIFGEKFVESLIGFNIWAEENKRKIKEKYQEKIDEPSDKCEYHLCDGSGHFEEYSSTGEDSWIKRCLCNPYE